MTASQVGDRRRVLSALLYALSSLGLAVAFHYVPYERQNPVALLVLFSPLIFLIPFVKLLLQSATDGQKATLLVLNGACGVTIAGYLWAQPYWPPPAEIPFWITIALCVITPAAFVLAFIALVSRHKAAYIAGTIALLLMWPCLLEDSIASRHFGPYGVGSFASVLAVLAFATAASIVFQKENLGYKVGLLAAILAWPYLVFREMSYPYHGNSWVMFNVPPEAHDFPEFTFAKLQILAVVLITISTIASLVRLFPGFRIVRGLPIRSRTWPVFVLSLIAIAAWFACSAVPYRVPTEHGGASPEISVVHAEKRGLRYRETRVSITRDGRFYLSHDVREPLRYLSTGEWSSGYVPLGDWQPVADLMRSPEFRASGRSTRNLPRRWNSDTWYISGERMHPLVFSTADNAKPPEEIVSWFNQMNTLPRGEASRFATRDICLGLCYEPSL